MCAARPAAVSAKLQRLIQLHDARFSSLATREVPLRWTHVSACRRTAVQMLGDPAANPGTVLWAPSCFMEDCSDATKSDGRGDHPLRPPLEGAAMFRSTESSSVYGNVTYLLNATFLHETSLFTLLLCHPLPSSPFADRLRMAAMPYRSAPLLGVTADPISVPPPVSHYWMQHGAWNSVDPGSEGESWLAAATPALNVQLSFSPGSGDGGAAVSSRLCGDGRHSLYGDDALHTPLPQNGLASGDYLESLIWPTEHSGEARPGLTSDCVWVDVATVCQYALGFYKDAIWVPFHPHCAFAPWNRERLVRGGGGGTGRRPDDSTEHERWLGNLFVGLCR